MPRLARAAVTVLALAVLAVLVDAPPVAAQGKKEVLVHATCPNNEGGPLTVTVNPWTATLAQGDDTVWKLKTNRPQDNTIRIEAKEASDWPYPDRELSEKDEVTFGKMKDAAAGDDYTYNITIYCGDEKVVIDPRVKVR